MKFQVIVKIENVIHKKKIKDLKVIYTRYLFENMLLYNRGDFQKLH